MTRSFEYRPDIDGLRAIAVLAVIAFHYKVPGFNGGFVGVDIFFVISGYLIGSLLIHDFQHQTFSFVDFYSRRVKRILPAMLTVILATSVAGFFLLPPNQYSMLSESVQFVSLLVSNYLFLTHQEDYWLQNTISSEALLHTWSLAIEEQFYLLFPGLLWIVFKLCKRNSKNYSSILLPYLSSIFLLSFAYSVWLSYQNSTEAFYLLSSRLWELLSGTIIAVLVSMNLLRIPRSVAIILGIIGALFLVVAIGTYHPQMKFPGLSALLPCLGTCFLIIAGLKKFQASPINQALSIKPLVFFGLLSYSLYLWHWPIHVLSSSPYFVYWQKVPPAWAQIFLTILLSIMTWRYIERPFRVRSLDESQKKHVLCIAVLGLILFSLLGRFMLGIAQESKPFRQPTPEGLQGLLPTATDVPFRMWQSRSTIEEILKNGGGTKLGIPKAHPDFVLMGDSHASMWGDALDRRSKELGYFGLILAKEWCASLDGIVAEKLTDCHKVNDAIFKFLQNSPVKNVVLAVNWEEIVPGGGPGYSLKPNMQMSGSLLYTTLKSSLMKLHQSGKKVFIVLRVPGDFPGYVGYMRAIASLLDNGKPIYHLTRQMHEHQIQSTDQRDIAKLQQQHPFISLDPSAHLCDSIGCLVAVDGKPIYHDNQHLSSFGAERAVKTFDPLFSALKAESSP